MFWYAEVIFGGSAYSFIILFNDDVSEDACKNECINCVERSWFIFLYSSTFIPISSPSWCKISWFICRESVLPLCVVDDVAECLRFLALLLVCWSNSSTLPKLLLFVESESFPRLLIICEVFTFLFPNFGHLQPYFQFSGHL